MVHLGVLCRVSEDQEILTTSRRSFFLSSKASPSQFHMGSRKSPRVEMTSHAHKKSLMSETTRLAREETDVVGIELDSDSESAYLEESELFRGARNDARTRVTAQQQQGVHLDVPKSRWTEAPKEELPAGGVQSRETSISQHSGRTQPYEPSASQSLGTGRSKFEFIKTIFLRKGE